MKVMFFNRRIGVLLAALFIAGLPAVSEASFANSLKKAYGGKLSSNSSTSTQQLTSDPAGILQGSVSTIYNPEIVSLSDILPGPYFNVSALIGIRLPGDSQSVERFVSDAAYFAGLPYSFTETGYLQVAFTRIPDTISQSVIDPLEGYTLIDIDGEIEGDDTHALFFSAINPNSSAIPSYTIYQEDGTLHNVAPDYLMNFERELFTSGITSATVSGAIPEPASGMIALLAVGGLALRRRR